MTGHIGCVSKNESPVRDRLLQAGVSVFSRSGFNGSSVQDITEAAGVPKGSFYNHFDSKETLAAAVVEYFWDDKASRVLTILDSEDVEPLARLRRYFEQAVVEMQARNCTCGCLVGNMTAELSDHSAVISDRLSAIYAQWTQRVARCLAQAQEAGQLRREADPAVLAAFALNAWEGATLRARVAKSSRPLQQFIDTLFTQLLR